MRHEIYSLGVCLLEVGLWGSFVKCDPTTAARRLSQQLTAPSGQGKEPASKRLKVQVEDRFIALARCRLPGTMGGRYPDIVKICLTCLDPGR
jgi:hypothetical protein